MAAPIKIVNTPRKTAETDRAEHSVTIHQFEGGWHGVTFKRSQVSISPSGEIHLEKHVRADDVEELVAALRAAAPVAEKAKSAQLSNLQKPDAADARRVISERLRSPTPALPSTPTSRPAFTAEQLAKARVARDQGRD